MSEHTTPLNHNDSSIPDDTALSEQELEDVTGGGDTINNCPNTNCPCTDPTPIGVDG